MASQRLLVLDFVRDYIARWSASPSYGEIGAALGIERSTVKRAVKSLASDGLLLRTPGPRGLAMPGAEAEAIRQLRALGWVVNPLASPEQGGIATKETLLPLAALDYPGPVADAGAKNGTSGRESDGSEARRRAQGAGPDGR